MSLESDVRDYLRTRPALMALLNNEEARCNMEWAGNAKATHLTLYRAGGYQHDYAPIDQAAINFHCYGTTRSVAADLAEQLARELRAVSLAAAPLASASVVSLSYQPVQDGTARYIVVATVTSTLVPVA